MCCKGGNGMLDICNNIKRFRLEREMTQRELAERLGVSPKTVSKWETGLGAPDISQIVPIANVFGVSADEMLLPQSAFCQGGDEGTANCAFPNIARYGVDIQTICESAHADRATVENAIMTGEFSQYVSDKTEVHRLGGVLNFLDSYIPHLLSEPNGMHILAGRLMDKLRIDNGVSYETVEKYAGLRKGEFESYLIYGVELPAKKERRLVSALFLLDNTLNKEEPFPWD